MSFDCSEFEKGLLSSLDSSQTEEERLIQQAAEREARWKERRIGKITSSNLDKLFNFDKQGHVKTKAGIDYLLEVVHQQQTGEDANYTSAAAMNFGKTYEEEALMYYNKVTGNNMLSGTYGFDEIVFIDDVIDGFGDSPDGITADGKGRAEIKCPYNGANHLRNCALSAYDDSEDYFWQIVGHLLDPKAEWCDFISYDPRYPDGHENKIKIIRVTRESIQKVLDMAKDKIVYWTDLIKAGDLLTLMNEA